MKFLFKCSHIVTAVCLIAGSCLTTTAKAQSDGNAPRCCDTHSCETDCCDSMNCDSGCFDDIADRLRCCGLIKPSDRCFDDFISPMINFVHFEDPRTVTELRPIFVNHWVPSTIGNNIPAGGTIQLFASQFRIALSDRLSLIGVKDGYIWDNSQGALDTLLGDGWASVTAGLKYNVIRDTQAGTLASVGATYELPIGSQDALQDIGDGEFHMFLSGAQRLACGRAHIMSALGARFAADSNVQTDSIHWSNHFDVKLNDRVYFLTEIAWWHWTDSAEAGLPLGVGGQDLFNLNSSDVDGNSLVTQNVGLKWKPSRSTEMGIAYEFPLTEFKDVIDSRLQTEIILRY